MKTGKAPPKKYYTSSGVRRKIGSWSYIKNRGVREWAKNKEREILAGTEKKIGKAGHVYIIDLGLGYRCYFKIGCSTNIERRLKDLRAANPGAKCAWSAWVKDMREVEKILHKHFEQYRVEREIFELTRAEVMEANEIVNKIKEEYAPY
jgi:predicted small metal-binding protein